LIGLPPDDLNAALGHVAMLVQHIARIFKIELPFELHACQPVTYFNLGGKEKLLLWLDPKDVVGRGLGRFVTALGLLNFCITWIATIIMAEHEMLSDWNGLYNFWLLFQWKPEYKPRCPSVSLTTIMQETFHSWNLHTGDGLNAFIPHDRLEHWMHSHLSRIS